MHNCYVKVKDNMIYHMNNNVPSEELFLQERKSNNEGKKKGKKRKSVFLKSILPLI